MISNSQAVSLRVSVIICTYNRAKSLSQALNSLARMSIPSGFAWELLVIDNNSADETSEIVESFRKRQMHVPLRYIFEPIPGLSCARNRAIQEARGEILAFLDDDVVVSEQWLVGIGRVFQQFDPACVGGRVLLHQDTARPSWWDKTYDLAVGEFDRGTEVIIDETEETLVAIGANIMFQRAALEKCGWFRTDMGRKANELATGEETDMVQRLRRAGLRVLYCPDALVYHCVPGERFSKPYLREHFYNSGQWYFLKELHEPGMEPRILGVPRWRYRSLLKELWHGLRFFLQRQPADFFLRELQAAFFLGYFRAAQKARHPPAFQNGDSGVQGASRVCSAPKRGCEIVESKMQPIIKGKEATSDAPPTVSVIIPAYCAAPYISEALQSVFAQTFQDFEVIVVNDGSPDTIDLERALAPFSERIRYFAQPNRGVSAARNYAIEHAHGSLLAFLDADDTWLPQYLDTQVQFLDYNPKAVAAVADVLLFGELAGPRVQHAWLRPGMGQFMSFADMICRRAGQLPSATVVRRASAIAAGLFDEELRLGEDIEFSMRISFPDSVVGYTKRALVRYRRHPGGAVAKLSARDITLNELQCLRRVRAKLPLDRRQRVLLEREIAGLEAELALMDAYEDLSQREFRQAANHLIEANGYYRDKRILMAIMALKIFPGWTSRILLARKSAANCEQRRARCSNEAA